MGWGMKRSGGGLCCVHYAQKPVLCAGVVARPCTKPRPLHRIDAYAHKLLCAQNVVWHLNTLCIYQILCIAHNLFVHQRLCRRLYAPDAH